MADHQPSFTMVEGDGEISYRRLPGPGSVAGGSLLELEISSSRMEAASAQAPDSVRFHVHVDLVRHVWGIEESDCDAVFISQHGTHVVLLVSGRSPRRRVVVEIGYDPAFGVDPKLACRGLEPHAMPHLRKMSDVLGGAYLEQLRPATIADAAPIVDVLVPLTIGKINLGFEAAGPLSPAPPSSRDPPPGLNLRMKPPFHLQPPPPPAFAHRALLLDVARHFHPKDDVMWLIDRAADLRLNVLHLHLTDDSGWRVEVSRYPQLTAGGAWRGHGLPVPSQYGSGPRAYGGFYTKEDVREIVAHAAGRGVEVIPEIDVPGHSFATLRALPHLVEGAAAVGASGDGGDAAAAAAAAAQGIGTFPDNCLNPALPQTLEFLTHVLDEVVELFAPCKRIHLGCDEVPRGAFASSPACRLLARREGYLSATGPGGVDETALVAHLMAPLQARLLEKGVEVMGWEEAAYGYVPPPRDGRALVGGGGGGSGGGNAMDASGSSTISSSSSLKFSSYLRPPATVCAWKGRGEAGPVAAKAGFNVVMMPAVHTYLDLAESDHPESPGLYWAAPCLTADDAAAFDPWAGFPSEAEAEASGGIEAASSGIETVPGGEKDGASHADDGNIGAAACRRRLIGVGAALWGEVCRNREDMAARLFPRRLAEVAKVAWMGAGSASAK